VGAIKLTPAMRNKSTETRLRNIAKREEALAPKIEMLKELNDTGKLGEYATRVLKSGLCMNEDFVRGCVEARKAHLQQNCGAINGGNGNNSD
jgi:hypothetical protein